MGRIHKRTNFLNYLERLCDFLPMLFWVLILFSFEEVFLAITSLICALIHELGHMVCIILTRKGNFSFRSVVNGFRIKPRGVRSYKEEILIYLSGPLANVFAFIVCAIMSIALDKAFATAAIINLATALSNLLPIRGYDGYGAIQAFINDRELPCSVWHTVCCLSTSMIFIFCILSLYFIDRSDGGYWIFAVFFVSMIKEVKEGLEK